MHYDLQVRLLACHVLGAFGWRKSCFLVAVDPQSKREDCVCLVEGANKADRRIHS